MGYPNPSPQIEGLNLPANLQSTRHTTAVVYSNHPQTDGLSERDIQTVFSTGQASLQAA